MSITIKSVSVPQTTKPLGSLKPGQTFMMAQEPESIYIYVMPGKWPDDGVTVMNLVRGGVFRLIPHTMVLPMDVTAVAKQQRRRI